AAVGRELARTHDADLVARAERVRIVVDDAVAVVVDAVAGLGLLGQRRAARRVAGRPRVHARPQAAGRDGDAVVVHAVAVLVAVVTRLRRARMHGPVRVVAVHAVRRV